MSALEVTLLQQGGSAEWWRGLPTEPDELRSWVAEEFNDGWTVLCGFEYCDENRFFGMEKIGGVGEFVSQREFRVGKGTTLRYLLFFRP